MSLCHSTGKPIALVANDALLFTSILAWFLTNVMNFYEFFSLKPVNMVRIPCTHMYFAVLL